MIYLDTSAAAKALIDEADSESVRRMFAEGTQFVSSKLLAVELHAVADRQFIASDAVQELLDRVALVSLDDDLLDDAIALHSRLRTLDALHLATAVRLKGTIFSILTFDNELAAAASRNGIPAAAPR
ncbi:putative nucleic acid-binding protein [Microbacterium sp. W4I4]|uniref:type II toxin-antitoxin system VapC family toxin n=1 Tax=Microbacterium sp. W4I4 TaxID=3042295 RepID=UPI002780C2B1|nr:type II toxin-antitoxin system VapC family toxin [Microbacterium sp. W4I4]MDQ0614422.1 putative nucleic acid-binding protein [Microbacterium sp. W4I4]